MCCWGCGVEGGSRRGNFYNSIPMISTEREIDGTERRERGSSFSPPICAQIPIITLTASIGGRH